MKKPKDTFGAYVIKKAQLCGKYDIPLVSCDCDEYPDFIALYSNIQDYHYTNKTAVCFYQYDEIFDDINSLWNAIILKKKKLLTKFKKRFANVRFIICPDYSITGDMPLALQIYNVYRSRVVAIWIRDNCNCILIPNLRFNNSKSYEFCFDGIAYKSVVCLSIYSLCRRKDDVENLINGLHEAIKTICPSAIILYGECELSKYNQIFNEVIQKNIPIIKPESRYSIFWRKKHGIAK